MSEYESQTRAQLRSSKPAHFSDTPRSRTTNNFRSSKTARTQPPPLLPLLLFSHRVSFSSSLAASLLSARTTSTRTRTSIRRRCNSSTARASARIFPVASSLAISAAPFGGESSAQKTTPPPHLLFLRASSFCVPPLPRCFFYARVFERARACASRVRGQRQRETERDRESS